MVEVNTKWNRFGTSIFTTMTQLANKYGAVNLAQGFPDFDGPEQIKHAAIDAITSGKNQYAPATGLPDLRRAIAEKQRSKHQLDFNHETEVTVFSGATEAIFSTLLAVCNPGDEVLVFEPFYDSYPAAILAANATIQTVSLEPPDWTFSLEALKRKINKRTKAIMINSPHNPTGKVFSQEELTAIAEIATKNDLLVITDEVYEDIVFKPANHICMASLPGMIDRTVTISSTSKSFSMTGWKIGYAFAKPHIMQAIRAVHQFIVFCSATPLQYGMLAAFTLPDSYYDRLQADYLKRRDHLLRILLDAGFICHVPLGSYFIIADYSALSKKSDMEFALDLVENKKVACVPISFFYKDQEHAKQKLHYVRFAFCKDFATLDEAKKRLQAV